MKKPCFRFCYLFLFAVALCAVVSANAALFVTKASQGSGSAWTAAIWSNAPSGTGVAPTAGNTYECIFNGTAWGNNTGNTRLRNPATDGLQTFPGDSLTLNTNTDIRFKKGAAGGAVSATICNFPGVNGAPGLILNGGILNPGDDIAFIVTGRVHVAGSAIIANGDNGGGNEQRLFRAMHLRGILTGTGPITLLQGQPTNANVMTCDGSGYSGNWIVQAGYLVGSGSNSLGTGNIFITPTNANAATTNLNFSVLELNYDINSPGTLVLSNHPTSSAAARMILHQNCIFSSIIINGTALTAGAHPYAELKANFPLNFANGGSGSLIVQPPAPPNAPTNVTVVNEDTKVTLSWTTPGNTAGFLVNRADVSGGPYTTVGMTAGNVTTFADTTVVNGSTYYYVIVATNSLGSSPNSAEVIGQPNPVVTGIVAVGGTNQVALSWDVLVNASDYTVLRSTASNGTYAVIATGVASTSYLDTTVQSGRTYWYRISAALTLGGNSGQSAAVAATTAPAAPVVTSSLFASTVIRLAWTSDPVVTGFSIEQSTDGVNFSPLASVGPSPKSYTNSGLAASTTYFYRVQAMNATGPSDYSAVVSNTTPAIGYNVNFQLGTAPIPPGYLKDIGDLYGDRTNGFFYGWATLGGTNINVDARWRNNASSPDLRYDTFIHMMKGTTLTNPALSAWWEMEIPNGFYSVRIVSGESDNFDGVYQFDVEGALTSAYTPTSGARWGDTTINVGVSDGRLTIRSGPLANNNKVTFLDIYPAIPTAPTITLQPAFYTQVEQNRPVSLVSGASGSPVLAYQWYFYDTVTTTPVPNGTNSTLTFARPQPANSGQYYLVVTNYGGSATSDVAYLEVTPDTEPAHVVAVGSLDGLSIGIRFNEEIDTNSGPAMDVGNYQVDGGNIGVISLTFRPDGKSVRLDLASPIVGSATLDVLDIPDYAGNATVSSTNVTPLGYTAQDIGGPVQPGSHFTSDNQFIEIVGGGADIWDKSDQGYFATKAQSGNFDARIRVNSLTGPHSISKVALVARESTNADSRNFHVSINPPAPARNQVEVGYRADNGTNTVQIGFFVPANNSNGWLRLTRIGNTFTGYRSTNGVDWYFIGQTNTTFPAALQLGFAITAHTNGVGLRAIGVVSELSVITDFPDLAVSKIASPEPVKVGSNVTYTITVTNAGPLDAPGAVLSDLLPAGLSFVSAVSSQGSCGNVGNAVTCALGNIPSLSYATVTIVATATNVGSITNTATATTTGVDGNPANNSGSVVTTVNATPPQPTIIPGSVSYSGGTFSASFGTVNGGSYTVQYKDDLNTAMWTTLTVITGDGTVKTFSDPGPLPPTRFYQIIAQ
jgi:uncharacterized repeat protein (TIGR01451 family)